MSDQTSPVPPPGFWDILLQIVRRLQNEFLLATLGLVILLIAAEVFTPALIGKVGREFFYLMLVLLWTAYIAVKAMQEWRRLRETTEHTTERNVTVGKEVGGSAIVTGDHNVVTVTTSSTPSYADLRTAYLNYLFDDVGKLTLAGIDPQAASDAETRLDLSAVYTGLLTLTPEEQERRRENPRAVPEFRAAARRLSALALLNEHPRLVLLGDPGSGKSTFVNFVALCMAGELLGRAEANLKRLTAPLPQDDEEDEKHAPPQPWIHGPLMPVRVVLRDFAARGLPPVGIPATAKHLWDFIVAELERHTLGEYSPDLQRELRERGLLLLDGLDEVPEADRRREQIKQAVEDWAKAYPRCRVLVTSRTYAYQQQEWRLPDFAEAILAPFGRGQIRRFIERWYAHIAQLRNMHPDDAQDRAERLKRAVFGSDRLLALAERPLLLTLMASLHAWRGGDLPEKREELYANAVDLLLDWWERPKVVKTRDGREIRQPSLAEWLRVDRQGVRSLLNQLAYEAHEAQPDLVGTADVPQKKLWNGLLALSRNPDVKPRRLEEYLSQRAGLLLPRGVGVYTFPHRTFQEYLAACHLTDHGYPDEVARLARRDPNRWREVARLAAAKAARGSPYALWGLVEALCERDVGRDESLSPEELWGALLAGQMVAENIADLERVGERDRRKLDRVREHLAYHVLRADGNDGRPALPPTERALAGRALARLGDPRFRPDAWYLPDDDLLGFVRIPAGPFLMGSGDDDEMAYDDEKPQHEVTLPEYYIARYPVTVAQWRVYLKDSGRKPRDRYSLRDLDNHPVRWVTWYEALRYCEWLTERLREWEGTPEPLRTLLVGADGRPPLPTASAAVPASPPTRAVSPSATRSTGGPRTR